MEFSNSFALRMEIMFVIVITSGSDSMMANSPWAGSHSMPARASGANLGQSRLGEVADVCMRSTRYHILQPTVKWKLGDHGVLALGVLGKTTSKGRKLQEGNFLAGSWQVKVPSRVEADSDIFFVLSVGMAECDKSHKLVYLRPRHLCQISNNMGLREFLRLPKCHG